MGIRVTGACCPQCNRTFSYILPSCSVYTDLQVICTACEQKNEAIKQKYLQDFPPLPAPEAQTDLEKRVQQAETDFLQTIDEALTLFKE